jgi:hypothetical protein
MRGLVEEAGQDLAGEEQQEEEGGRPSGNRR